jgi:hypothetical protein
MADDFRLTVEFADQDHGLHLTRVLHERELEKEIRDELGQKVMVTRDGSQVHLYTATRQQAEAAARLLDQLIAEHDFDATVLPLVRWHPVEMRWEDASVSLPTTEEEIEAERRRWEDQEAKETQELGYAEWEVRVELPSHADAEALADRLENEGIKPIVRRWKFLLIGAANGDQARELVERIRAEAPEGADVLAEASATIGWEATANTPFSVFGSFGPGPKL